MKILIIGSGGREHALARKLAENPRVEKIYGAPGNAGFTLHPKTENIPLSRNEDFLDFAVREKIDLTLVGSEEFLAEGIVDRFQKENRPIWGPSRRSAALESNKAYAKGLMKKYGVRTADYEEFREYEKALRALDRFDYPLVIKASGLAAGKGVVIAGTRQEAERILGEMMCRKVFGAAGETVLLEEYLEGPEASILSLCDRNTTILPLLSAKDHKKIGAGETGLNTGGMGVVVPNPYYGAQEAQDFRDHILEPTRRMLREEQLGFAGVIFFGLMLTRKGVYLLEYNLRPGDPETQAVLPLLESDLLSLIEKSLAGTLEEARPVWSPRKSLCVVGVSGGYPEAYRKGLPVEVKDRKLLERGIAGAEDAGVFWAGAEGDKEGNLKTAGGRVVNAVARGDSYAEARKKAYGVLSEVEFEGMYFREDIGADCGSS